MTMSKLSKGMPPKNGKASPFVYNQAPKLRDFGLRAP